MEKIKELLGSRKFWAMAAAVIGIVATEGRAGTWKVVAIVAAWIGSQAAVDVAKTMNPPATDTGTPAKS